MEQSLGLKAIVNNNMENKYQDHKKQRDKKEYQYA